LGRLPSVGRWLEEGKGGKVERCDRQSPKSPSRNQRRCSRMQRTSSRLVSPISAYNVSQSAAGKKGGGTCPVTIEVPTEKTLRNTNSSSLKGDPDRHGKGEGKKRAGRIDLSFPPPLAEHEGRRIREKSNCRGRINQTPNYSVPPSLTPP